MICNPVYKFTYGMSVLHILILCVLWNECGEKVSLYRVLFVRVVCEGF